MLSATVPEYRMMGYVPFDKEAESVSKTLEYAYDDYCMAQAAKALGKEDDYRYFLNRALLAQPSSIMIYGIPNLEAKSM